MELNILLSRWLSRCILRVTKEKIKLKFRQLEKYKLKNLKAESHLVFNETCLNNNLLPVYTNVRLHDDAARNETFVLEFRRNRIKRQINEEKNFIIESDKQVDVLFREFCVLVNSPLRY